MQEYLELMMLVECLGLIFETLGVICKFGVCDLDDILSNEKEFQNKLNQLAFADCLTPFANLWTGKETMDLISLP